MLQEAEEENAPLPFVVSGLVVAAAQASRITWSREEIVTQREGEAAPPVQYFRGGPFIRSTRQVLYIRRKTSTQP